MWKDKSDDIKRDPYIWKVTFEKRSLHMGKETCTRMQKNLYKSPTHMEKRRFSPYSIPAVRDNSDVMPNDQYTLKETYGKRPIHAWKETYTHMKRDLYDEPIQETNICCEETNTHEKKLMERDLCTHEKWPIQ